MRLLVSLGGSTINELKFDRGPIYIGRQMGSQVFLPDKAVSRQHTVLYTTKDGTWIVEDLNSANKTYLNEKAIHKNEVKNGDVIHIADFTIRVSLDKEDEDQNRMVEMEETAIDTETQIRRELHTVDRVPQALDAPPVRFPAHRIEQFCQAMLGICAVKTLPELHQALIDLLLSQFSGLNAWVCLRSGLSGKMEITAGKKLTTESVDRLNLAVPRSLDEVLEKHKYMLVHQLPRQIANRGVRSVIIAPILFEKGCFGALYVENSTEHPHYSLPDLDYLMLIAVYTGLVIHKLSPAG